YANLQVESLLMSEFLSVLFPLILHAQGCIEGTPGMIFVRDGRAKKGEDTIAGGLHDVAFVTMDRFHHQLQDGVDNRASLLRVDVFDQIHRAFDVSKKGGDRFSLACDRTSGDQGSLLGQDTFDKVWRGIT